MPKKYVVNRNQQRQQSVEQSISSSERLEKVSNSDHSEENFWLQHSGVTSDERVRNTALAGLLALIPAVEK